MSLKEYKAKRNFARTAEPSGKVRKAASAGKLRFVVQKHDATRLHYDFRLEMEGVLKSWAVPKGFPAKRGDRRLAVEVEDHPLDYGGFEGTIPEGSYGAGTVMLWDRGTYRVSGDDPIGSLRAGKLHFFLEGKKLKGEWALVRMRSAGEAKPQWLLLKSGSDVPPFSARMDNQSVLTHRTMDEIAGAKKKSEWQSNRSSARAKTPRSERLHSVANLRGSTASRSGTRKSASAAAGLTPPSVAGIDLADLPSGKPRYLEPMKALLTRHLPSGSGWIYEIKFDGVRALAIKDGAALKLVSRSANDLTGKYSEIVDALRTISAKTAVLDGEVAAIDEQGRTSFQLLQAYHNAAKRPPLIYYVFDLIHLEGKDLTGLPLWQRKELAEQLLSGMPGNIRFSRSFRTDSERLVKEMQARGLEGLLAKKRDSVYEVGRRGGAWLKYKWSNEQEFVIGGYTAPKGGRNHFGALLVGYYESGKLLFAGKVGTGFDQKLLASLSAKFKKLERPDCPFANLPERIPGPNKGLTRSQMRFCTWLEPRLVCQVRFAEWTRDHRLRQPAFLGLREDKAPPEVVRERAALYKAR